MWRRTCSRCSEVEDTEGYKKQGSRGKRTELEKERTSRERLTS